MTPVGLPHSGIHGSKPAYDSPWHFAVNRALLRLLAPRHPPYALSSLTYSSLLLGFTQYLRIDVNSFDFTRFFSLCSFQRAGRSGCRGGHGCPGATKEQNVLARTLEKYEDCQLSISASIQSCVCEVPF